ncbi:hypothetical protein KC968_02040 [Candidatus Saccharibacteria bacterium]|nr:hypothetical protein [Candidatus Saccharibacteria bacterium]
MTNPEQNREKIMVPVNVDEYGMGTYTYEEQHHLEADVVSSKEPEGPSLQRAIVVAAERSGKFMRNVKRVGVVGLVGAVGIAGLQVKQWVEDWRNPFGAPSEHKAELTVDAPQTEVFEDVYLNLATIESTFGVSLDTSLDRPGPFNCDTQTRLTGKDGEDDKITTATHAGLEIGRLSVKREGDEVVASIEGDIVLTDSSVDYRRNSIAVEGMSGGVDVCIGTNEITWARNIVDTAVQGAGNVAASCAMQDESGKEVFENGIRTFVASTDLTDGLSEQEIKGMKVVIDDYDNASDAMYGSAVQAFRRNVGGVMQSYLDETKDGSHKKPKINDSDLLDCSKHTITIGNRKR